MARWYAMSTQFLTDPKVERMIDRHGNDAVAVSLALMSQAMLQESGGTVERTYRTLARESNTDRDTAFDIVQTAIEVELLRLENGNDFEFTVSFPAWSRHQANFRKARSRGAEKASDKANVTPCHEQVTPGHKKSLTRQDKTREEKNTSKAGKPAVSFQDWLAHFHEVTGRTSMRGSKTARGYFAARIREGHTLEDLKAATVGCQSDQWRVDNGHNKPETILAASNVEGYISQARDKPNARLDRNPYLDAEAA